jgi:hypothetical protein
MKPFGSHSEQMAQLFDKGRSTMAQQHTPMYMSDRIERLDVILRLNGRELLNHAGKISHKIALEKSGDEFNKYRISQKKREKLESLEEIENDIKSLKKKDNP